MYYVSLYIYRERDSERKRNIGIVLVMGRGAQGAVVGFASALFGVPEP